MNNTCIQLAAHLQYKIQRRKYFFKQICTVFAANVVHFSIGILSSNPLETQPNPVLFLRLDTQSQWYQWVLVCQPMPSWFYCCYQFLDQPWYACFYKRTWLYNHQRVRTCCWNLELRQCRPEARRRTKKQDTTQRWSAPEQTEANQRKNKTTKPVDNLLDPPRRKLPTYEVNDCKILDFIGNTHQYFILHHAGWILITTETNDDDTIFFSGDHYYTINTRTRRVRIDNM